MKKIMLAAMAALAITGCSQNEEMDAPSQKAEIGFNSFVGKATRTKPMVNDDFNNFKVYAYSTGDAKIANVTDVSLNEFIGGKDVDKSSEVWTIAGAPYYWPLTDNIQFFAYSPKASTAVSSYTATSKYPTFDYTVKAVADQEDLLAALATDQTKEGNVSGVVLTFKHLLTQVNFSVKGETTGNEYIVTKIQITGVNSKATYSFDPTGGWGGASVVADYEYDFADKTFTATADAVNLSTGANALMLMPQALSGAKIKVSYDVKQRTTVISQNEDVEVAISGTWVANQKIRYTLTLSDNGTKIELKPSVVDWDAETSETVTPAP